MVHLRPHHRGAEEKAAVSLQSFDLLPKFLSPFSIYQHWKLTLSHTSFALVRSAHLHRHSISPQQTLQHLPPR